MRLFAVLSVAVFLAGCGTSSYPYTASSKSQGAPFDLVVTEIKREPNKSYISVPGFHKRTAPAARWLMCIYTDLAMKRGFSYWVVSYPPEGSEVLVVGLTNSNDVTAEVVLGADYDAKLTLGKEPMPVSKMFPMCGFGR